MLELHYRQLLVDKMYKHCQELEFNTLIMSLLLRFRLVSIAAYLVILESSVFIKATIRQDQASVEEVCIK
mgnify:FL=1